MSVIYLVMSGDEYSPCVEDAYSDRGVAEMIAAKIEDGWVEECNLDENIEDKLMDPVQWHTVFNENGLWHYTRPKRGKYHEVGEVYKREYTGIDGVEYAQYEVYIIAKDQKSAKAQAIEVFTPWFAEHKDDVEPEQPPRVEGWGAFNFTKKETEAVQAVINKFSCMIPE
jgi:hypothetical protein